MFTPAGVTPDGIEIQFATDHLGHFALTGLLLDNLAAAGEARVVSLSSITHKNAHLDFDDLKDDMGFGLRFHGPFATPLRVELATSRESRISVIFASSASF